MTKREGLEICCNWCQHSGECTDKHGSKNCCPYCGFYMDCPVPWHKAELRDTGDEEPGFSQTERL